MSFNGLGYKRKISNDRNKAPVTSCRHGLVPLFSLIYRLVPRPLFFIRIVEIEYLLLGASSLVSIVLGLAWGFPLSNNST